MRIEHLALWVADLELTKSFYQKYFGGTSEEKYENQSKGFSSYFITFESGCRLELMTMSGILEVAGSRGDRMGLTHFAISVGSEEQVTKFTDQLRADGVVVKSEPRWTGDGYFESVVLDPEGNYVEITI